MFVWGRVPFSHLVGLQKTDVIQALIIQIMHFSDVTTSAKQQGDTANDAAVDVPNDVSHLFDCPGFKTRYHVASRDSYFLPDDELLAYVFQ